MLAVSLSCALVQMLGLAYGALNVQRLDILLVFLVQWHQKFNSKWMLYTSSSSIIFTWPTATDRHSIFFIWNLIMDFTSSTLAIMFSLWVSKEGSLPMLFRSGPRIYGTCLNRDSGAKKSYLLASFLTRFLLFSSVPWCSYGRFIHSLSLITVLLVSQNIYGELGKGNELKPDSAEKCLSFWGHSSSRWSEDPPFPEHFGTCVDSHAGLPALSHTGCHRRLHCSWCLVPQ